MGYISFDLAIVVQNMCLCLSHMGKDFTEMLFLLKIRSKKAARIRRQINWNMLMLSLYSSRNRSCDWESSVSCLGSVSRELGKRCREE